MKNDQKKQAPSESMENRARKSQGRGNNGGSRISREILQKLRNQVPVQWLIQEKLDIRHHMDGPTFRFECPHCGCFHTSVLKRKNLARCFECNINFNPIDLVMEIRKMKFLETTRYLLDIFDSIHEKKQDYRTGAGTRSMAEILSESKFAGASPTQKLYESRILNLEKEFLALKNRMDQFHRFLVNISAKQR